MKAFLGKASVRWFHAAYIMLPDLAGWSGGKLTYTVFYFLLITVSLVLYTRTELQVFTFNYCFWATFNSTHMLILKNKV